MYGEEAKANRGDILVAVNEMYKEVINAESGVNVARVCLEKAISLTGSTWGGIWKKRVGGFRERVTVSSSLDARTTNPSLPIAEKDELSLVEDVWTDVVEDGRTSVINERPTLNVEEEKTDKRESFSAVLAVPLMRNDESIGMIMVAGCQSNYSSVEREVLEALSGPIVEVLNRRKEDEVQGVIKDLASWLSACTDFDAAIEDVLDTVILLDDVHVCALFELSEKEAARLMAHRASVSCPTEQLSGFRMKPVLLEELSLGETIHAAPDELPDYIEACCIQDTVKATAFLPLRYGQSIEGLLVAASFDEKHFSKQTKNTLESLAVLAGATFGRLKAQREEAVIVERFRQLFEESPVSVWEVNLSKAKSRLRELEQGGVSDVGTFLRNNPQEAYGCLVLTESVDVNKAAMHLFQATDKSSLLNRFEATFNIDSLGSFVDMLVALCHGNKEYQSETSCRTLTGRRIWVHARWAVIQGNESDLSKVLFSAVDITERKMAEEVAWEANSNLEQLFDSTADGICVVDRSFTITRVNKQFPFLDGRSKEELVGLGCADVLCLPGCGTDQCSLNRLLSGEQRVESEMMVERDGTQRPFIISSSPLTDAEGEIMGMISIIKDMTERKEMERKLMQSQKLESIGQLSAGIAHEINTPIQYVGDNIRFLEDTFGELLSLFEAVDSCKEEVKKDANFEAHAKQLEEAFEEADLEFLKEEVPSAIGQSLEGITRVSEIVSAMKAFSHPGSETKTETDINAALKTTITVARNEWKYVAEMETDFDDQLPFVSCFPGALNQAFLNIIVNASHAIAEKKSTLGEKGKIRVSTKLVKPWVEVRIEDNGTGIPEKIQTKIFDPFFTTKDVGKGTGQGLSMVHSTIVDTHDGEIAVESQQSIGTTFILKLPLRGSIDKN